MADKGKRERGRIVVLPVSARKRRRKEQTAVYFKTMVILGRELKRWKELKKHTGMKTDAQLAALLSESFFFRTRITCRILLT